MSHVRSFAKKVLANISELTVFSSSLYERKFAGLQYLIQAKGRKCLNWWCAVLVRVVSDRTVVSLYVDDNKGFGLLI